MLFSPPALLLQELTNDQPRLLDIDEIFRRKRGRRPRRNIRVGDSGQMFLTQPMLCGRGCAKRDKTGKVVASSSFGISLAMRGEGGVQEEPRCQDSRFWNSAGYNSARAEGSRCTEWSICVRAWRVPGWSQRGLWLCGRASVSSMRGLDPANSRHASEQ